MKVPSFVFWRMYNNVALILDQSRIENAKHQAYSWLTIVLTVVVISRNIVFMFDKSPDRHHWGMCIAPDFISLSFMIISAISLFTFSGYLTYFYFVRYVYFEKVLALPTNIIIDNTDDVLQSNRWRFKDLFIDKQLFLSKLIRLFRDLAWPENNWKNASNIRFQRKLEFFPATNRQMRGRAFLLLVAIETFYAFLGSSAAITVMAFHMNAIPYMLSHHHSLLQLTWMLLEVWIVSILIFKLYQMSMILISWILLSQYGLYCCFKIMNGVVGRANHRMDCTLLAKHLKWFVRSHIHLVEFILNCSNVYKSLFAIFLVTNMPLNVYFLVLLVFRSIPFDQKVTFSWIIFMQISGGFIAIVPCAMNTKQVHASSKHFVPILGALNSPAVPIGFKYRLMRRYELINSNRKIGYSAGPLGAVTIANVVEFVLFYSTIFIFMLSKLKALEQLL